MSAAGRRATAAPPTQSAPAAPQRRVGVVTPGAETPGMPAILRYVLRMFAHAHQALMMALLPGPVGVR